MSVVFVLLPDLFMFKMNFYLLRKVVIKYAVI
jgi:hypothetical protein